MVAGRTEMREIVVDGVELHVDAIAVDVDGHRVAVTWQEFRILSLLMEEPGRVLPRQEILDRLWGIDKGRTSNSLSVLMSRLRRKLTRLDGSSRIRTVRSVGYAFDLPGNTRPPGSTVHEVS